MNSTDWLVLAEEAYDAMVVVYVRPNHPAYYVISSLSFLTISILALLSCTNGGLVNPARQTKMAHEAMVNDFF
ncbi:hypothetical protein BASA81_006643 [Batrachochytrium salamandrivorans]|nr:hypothetical protein BASA81_006643 [Batrachochytrium salamandrivorans]